MKVAIAQIEITEDREKNLKKGSNFVTEAIRQDSTLIVLPEVFNTGFYPENYDSVETPKEELAEIIEITESSESLVIAGITEKQDGKLFSSAIIINGGEIKGIYRKTRIFPLTDEIRYFSPGNVLEVYNTSAGKIGLMICYEIRFPEIARKLTFTGAEILVIPAQFPSERINHWIALLKARAIENQIFVIGANCSNFGKSMIVDPWGEVLAEAEAEEGLITAHIDIGKMKKIRKKYPFLELTGMEWQEIC
jgi:predicted amidohydrolase